MQNLPAIFVEQDKPPGLKERVFWYSFSNLASSDCVKNKQSLASAQAA
jgi:hypothetical protein